MSDKNAGMNYSISRSSETISVSCEEQNNKSFSDS